MDKATEEALTTIVVPCIGLAVNAFVYLSPAHGIYKAFREKNVTDVSPEKLVLYMFQGIGWLFYGCVLGNPFVVLSNCLVPVVFGYHWLVLAASDKHDVAYHRRGVVLAVICAFILEAMGLTIAFLPDRAMATQIAGIFGVSAGVIGFSSPLVDAAKVVRLRDSASIDPIMIAATLLNGTLWTVYGLAINVPFVWAPNIGCFIAGAMQLVLKVAYHRGNYFQCSCGRRADAVGARKEVPPVISNDAEECQERVSEVKVVW